MCTVGVHLGIVAHLAQQAIGDTRVPRDRRAISSAPSSSTTTSRMCAARYHDGFEVGRLVEVESFGRGRTDRAADP
jgi:hypothetical protein